MAYRIIPIEEVATEQRDPRKKDDVHLDMIRMLTCVSCGRAKFTEAAHIRFPDPAYGKKEPGAGNKPHDRWTVPLCHQCHRTGRHSQHNSNEKQWWAERGIDVCAYALALHSVSPDVVLAQKITNEWSYKIKQHRSRKP